MSDGITVKDLAVQVRKKPEQLLEQLKQAGVEVSDLDSRVTAAGKKKLLEYLRGQRAQTSGAGEKKKTISLGAKAGATRRVQRRPGTGADKVRHIRRSSASLTDTAPATPPTEEPGSKANQYDDFQPTIVNAKESSAPTMIKAGAKREKREAPAGGVAKAAPASSSTLSLSPTANAGRVIETTGAPKGGKRRTAKKKIDIIAEREQKEYQKSGKTKKREPIKKG